MGQIQDFFKQTVFAEFPDEPSWDQLWPFLLLIPTGIIIGFVTWFLINSSAAEDSSKSNNNTCCDETEVTTTCSDVTEDSCIINSTLITGGQIIETECDTNGSHAMSANSDFCAADDNTNSVQAEITTITKATVINTDEDSCIINSTLITGGQIIETECDTNGSHAIFANSDRCAADDNTNSVQAETTTIRNATVINTDENGVNSDKAADDNTKEELTGVDTNEVSNSTEENVVNSTPEKTEVVNHTEGTTIVRRARTLGRGRARK